MFDTVSAGSCKGLTKIVDYAFKELDHKSFIFPSNGPLKYLGKGAFQGCSNIEDVYCYAETVPKTHENAFLDARIESTTLHIPAIALDGKALGSAKSIDGSVSFSAKQGTVVVAKIGKESVKIIVE